MARAPLGGSRKRVRGKVHRGETMKTRNVLLGPLLAALPVLGAAGTTAQQTAPDYVVVSHFDVNVRTGPATDRVVIGLARKGDLFVYTGEVGDWFEIEVFSDDHRYISKAHVYPLTASQIVPGHRLRLPPDSIARSLHASIQWAIDRAQVEATELLPASVDSARHRVLRNVIFDRLVLGFFAEHGAYGVQPAVYRALLNDMGAGRDTLPSVDRILARYLEAVGGRDPVERCTTRVVVGRVVTDLPSRDPPVHEESLVEIRSAVPDGFVLTEHTPAGVRWDGYDGEVRWSADEAGITRLDRVDVRFAWLVNPQNVLRLRTFFPRMTLRGTRDVKGRTAYVIDIDGDRSHALFFDAESGLLVRLGYNREVGDYHEVDGVLVPFRLSYSRKGGSSTYLFEKIQHNVAVDRRQFAMPDTVR